MMNVALPSEESAVNGEYREAGVNQSHSTQTFILPRCQSTPLLHSGNTVDPIKVSKANCSVNGGMLEGESRRANPYKRGHNAIENFDMLYV